MTCTTNNTSKSDVIQRPNNLYGAPQGQSGREFSENDYGVQGIILHCTDMTISQYVSYLACLTQPVPGSNQETNHHYSIGSSGAINQHIIDGNISWTFGNYNAPAYPAPPTPTRVVDWPVLQDLNGIDTSPDVYVINIVVAKQAEFCLTSSGLPADQHEKLVKLIAYLAVTYNIPLTSDYINWHDNILGEGNECDDGCTCTDINTLFEDITFYCNECDGCISITYPEVSCTDISHLLALSSGCGNTNCCAVSIPFNACCFGDIPIIGDIEQFVGIATDGESGELCLVKNTIAVTLPITGDGSIVDPLALDLCSFGDVVPDGTPITMLGINSQGCLIESPLPASVVDNETLLTVVDTSTINLTAGGVNGHELTAGVNISGSAGNLLEINPDGLFVDFLCSDLVGFFSQGIIKNLYGIDTGGECVFEDVTQVVNTIICNTTISDGLELPTHLLGQSISNCPIFFTPIEIVSAGFSVQDTNSIDLTFDINTGILQADAIRDGAADNVLQITANGLYVPQLTSNALDDCVTVQIIGNQLNVGVNIGSATDNILTCSGNGLYVKDLVVLDSSCLNFTYNPVTRQLDAEIIIASNLGGIDNAVDCEINEGLYVPRGANLLANLPITGNGADGSPLDVDFSQLSTADFCDLGNAIPGITPLIDVIGRDSSGCLSYVTGESFINTFLSVQNTDCIDLSLVGNILSADIVRSPPIGGINNALYCTATGLYVSVGAGIVPVNTNCISLQLVNGILTATITEDTNPDNQVTCNVNGLYTPRGAGLGTLGGNGVNLSILDGILSAEAVVDPDGCNGLELRVGGLFINNDFVNSFQESTIPTVVLFSPISTVLSLVEAAVITGITNSSLCNTIKCTIFVSGMSISYTNNLTPAKLQILQEYSLDNGFSWITPENQNIDIDVPVGSGIISTPSILRTITIAPGGAEGFGVRRSVGNSDNNFNGSISVKSQINSNNCIGISV